MAEHLLVPAARYLIPLGTLDPRQAAPLGDAGLTGYHTVKRSLHLLGPGSTAGVIGADGLGQTTIQILRALGTATTVVAVDTDAGTWRPPSAWVPTRLCSRATLRSPASSVASPYRGSLTFRRQPERATGHASFATAPRLPAKQHEADRVTMDLYGRDHAAPGRRQTP